GPGAATGAGGTGARTAGRAQPVPPPPLWKPPAASTVLGRPRGALSCSAGAAAAGGGPVHRGELVLGLAGGEHAGGEPSAGPDPRPAAGGAGDAEADRRRLQGRRLEGPHHEAADRDDAVGRW